MPRPRTSIPKLCQNSRGDLFAKDRNGRQHWFGQQSDPGSGEKYADFIARILRGDLVTDAEQPATSRPGHTINE